MAPNHGAFETTYHVEECNRRTEPLRSHVCYSKSGQHSTEVAFVPFTQLTQVQIPAVILLISA